MKKPANSRHFIDIVWAYFDEYGRDLPWRLPEPDGRFDPYKILVSEMMLQQTQVSRVIPKYEAFIRRFPAETALAKAPLSEVLKLWSGLGYNRRAKYLHDAIRQLAEDQAPSAWTFENLVACKGVGKNTAAAVMVYAYNQPLLFIETNIRTVYLHHFFQDESGISDGQILPLLGKTLDKEHPREFYWALMDYGSHLKKTIGNNIAQSRHYTRQSPLEGSRRQVRGRVLKYLTDRPATRADLARIIADQRLAEVLGALTADGLIHLKNGKFQLYEP